MDDRTAMWHIDRLWQVHNARKSIRGLLQACETATDAGMLVELHNIGGLMELLEEIEQHAFDALQTPPETRVA